MLGYVALALINGTFIGASRAINGRLGMSTGAMNASLWNHVVGFIFLTVILMTGVWWLPKSGFIVPVDLYQMLWDAPGYAYLGGFMGALFVAVNSSVLPRIGAIQTTVLVVSGQMLAGVLMEADIEALSRTSGQIGGVILIVAGIYIGRKQSS